MPAVLPLGRSHLSWSCALCATAYTSPRIIVASRTTTDIVASIRHMRTPRPPSPYPTLLLLNKRTHRRRRRLGGVVFDGAHSH